MRASVMRTLGPATLTVPSAAPSPAGRIAAASAVTPGSASFTASPNPRRAVDLISRISASTDRIALGPYLSASVKPVRSTFFIACSVDSVASQTFPVAVA